MPQASKADIEAKVNMAREFVLALDRAVRTRRMYPTDHLRSVEVVEDLVARILRFFDTYAYLRLEVQPDQLLFENHSLIRTDAKMGSMSFAFYKDGIREIRFHRGISRDELLDFLNVIETDPRELDAAGKDLVSLLWDRDFASIDFAAVDEFDADRTSYALDPDVEGEVQSVAKAVEGLAGRMIAPAPPATGVQDRDGAAPRVVSRDVVFATPGLDTDKREHASTAPTQMEAPPYKPPTSEMLDPLFAVAPEAAHREMLGEVETDTIGSSIGRALDALNGISEDLTGQEIEDMVVGFAEYYVKKRDFGAIGHLLTRLKAIEGHEAAVTRAIGVLTAGVPLDKVRGELLEFLNRRFTDDLDGLTRFLATLGPDAVPTLCRIYSHISSPRTRRALHPFIVKHAGSSPLALRELLQSSEKMLSEVLDLLLEMNPPSIVHELEEYVRHPLLTVRLQAISLLGHLTGLERTRLLVSLLEDPDRQIRLHVLATFAAAKDPGTAIYLKEWVSRADFNARDVDEKESGCFALAAVGGSKVIPWLEEVALTRPPRLGRQRFNETRRAAVFAIGKVKALRAELALEKISSKGDETVREYARQASRK